MDRGTTTTENAPMITAENVDLSNCDREQVQFSGAVQPHGAMLVLAEADLRVLQASANCATLLGTPAVDSLLGQPLEHALGQVVAHDLRDLLARPGTSFDSGPVHGLRAILASGVFDTFVHRVEGGLILELEIVRTEPAPLLDLYSDLNATVARLQAIRGLQAFFDLACGQLRGVTGYDRVMAYKFLDDGSGDVVAESAADGLESYVGLRYPASDIPAPARRLFALSCLRHLPDSDYVPVPLVPEFNPATNRPLDQSRALLRSVSVMYSGYLKNMGAHGTMVLPLMKEGSLWGLISCIHHSAPLHVSHERRMAAEFLAHMLSLMMAAKEDAETRDYRLQISGTIDHLVRSMIDEPVFHHGLTKRDPNVLNCLNATGAVLAIDGVLTLMGRTPSESQVRGLVDWLGTRGAGEPVFSTDRLPSLYPEASVFQATATGVLTVRLIPHRPDYVMWFRPEIEQTVQWAGNPDKPVETTEANGEILLSPRLSFALWKQSVRGRSDPWTNIELQGAADLRRAIVDIIIQQADALKQANRELSRSNVELDTFAYMASHDLKEPLRGINNYASFLLRGHAEQLGNDGREKLDTILRLTKHMEDLIESLLHYSRVGRLDLSLVATDLDVVVDEALMTLGSRINGVSVKIIRPRRLPTINCDRIRVREIFSNLVSNALKYNSGTDQRRIEIGWTSSDAIGTPTFYVRDNGIGIDPIQHRRIFEIFRRLHGRDAYGGGTGVGLTIVRRLAERHGGRVWVESALGQGSTFYFTLAPEAVPTI